MVLLVNTSDTIGQAIMGMNNITGSFYISLLIIFVLLLAVAMVLRIPVEFTAVLMLPLAIGFTVASNSFLPVLIVILLYAGLLLARNFIFNN